MADDEDLGTAEIGRWCRMLDGTEMQLLPTSKVGRFRIRRRPPQKRASKVRVRHLGRKNLTTPKRCDTELGSGDVPADN